MKRYVLLDHDGVLVDTERWDFEAGARALAEVAVVLDETRYLNDMSRGLRSALAAGIHCAVVDNHVTRGGDHSGRGTGSRR